MYNILFGIAFVICFIVILFFMIWPISIPFLIIYLIKRNNNRKYFKSTVVNSSTVYKDISPDKLVGFDITDLSKMKIFLYDIFYRFETAYNSLDYNTMYNLCTSKIYGMYQTNMNINSKFDQKRIIEAIELKDMIIYGAYASDKKYVVYTMIEISYINYTQTSKGKIMSGNPSKKVTERFEVTFVKELSNKKNYRCPNCGANVTSTTCDYCKSKINDFEFKIDSIRKISS